MRKKALREPTIAELRRRETAPGAICKHLPDGSLFMAATREIFSADDPAHVAAARAIFGVVESLNFVSRFTCAIVSRCHARLGPGTRGSITTTA